MTSMREPGGAVLAEARFTEQLQRKFSKLQVR
jgi:hypothetical protein